MQAIGGSLACVPGQLGATEGPEQGRGRTCFLGYVVDMRTKPWAVCVLAECSTAVLGHLAQAGFLFY